MQLHDTLGSTGLSDKTRSKRPPEAAESFPSPALELSGNGCSPHMSCDNGPVQALSLLASEEPSKRSDVSNLSTSEACMTDCYAPRAAHQSLGIHLELELVFGVGAPQQNAIKNGLKVRRHYRNGQSHGHHLHNTWLSTAKPGVLMRGGGWMVLWEAGGGGEEGERRG